MASDEQAELAKARRVIRVLVILVVVLALVAGYLWTVEKKRNLNLEKVSLEQSEEMIADTTEKIGEN